MYAKKIKRKCGVRGCRNTVSYAISKSREMGNSIIACKECLAEALAEIELKYAPPVEAPAEAVEEAPSVDKVVDEAVAETTEAPTEAHITPKKRKK